MIKNANSEFIDLKGNGKLEVKNLDDDMTLFINGGEYGPIKKGVFKSAIEFGLFNLRV